MYTSYIYCKYVSVYMSVCVCGDMSVLVVFTMTTEDDIDASMPWLNTTSTAPCTYHSQVVIV